MRKPIRRAPWARPALLGLAAALLLAAGGCGPKPAGAPSTPAPAPAPTARPNPTATDYPDGSPALTIPLDGLAPYEAPALTVEPLTGGRPQLLRQAETEAGTVCLCRSDQDGRFLALVRSEAPWQADRFFQVPDGAGEVTLTPFSQLFGYSGLIAAYTGQVGPSQFAPVYDYFTFAGGTPRLLLRAWGGLTSPQPLDLDGDGIDELVSDEQIFFWRAGQIYLADLPQLLAQHWPALSFWDYGQVLDQARCVRADGLMTLEGWQGQDADFTRYLYFDGDSLLVYRDQRETVDHVLAGIDAPAPVLEAAKARAAAQYDAMRSWPEKEGLVVNRDFDDWRITALDPVPLADYSWQWEGPEVLVYYVRMQLHSPAPQSLVIAGGSTVDEEGWYSFGYSPIWRPYLVYVRQADGTLRQLDDSPLQDTETGSPRFLEALEGILAQAGCGQAA